MSIYGRDRESQILKKLLDSDKGEFLAVYGRRRVGKTFLIREYYRARSNYFEVTGINNASLETQLQQFHNVYSQKFNSLEHAPKDWHEAFNRLVKQLDLLKGTKTVLFFDEVPWFASPRSNFMEALDHFWNRFCSQMPHVILVVCGSAASWMIDNIIQNTKGLYGRLTQHMHLLPFTLRETEDFLLSKGINWDRKQLIEFYMAVGGIPKYLEQATPGFSASQAIQKLFFHKDGFLVREFNHLFQSLFSNHEKHIQIIRQLFSKPYGQTRSELINEKSGLHGGRLTAILNELETSGFIFGLPQFGKKKHGANYRLVDSFSLFYLKWIDSIPRAQLESLEDQYWENMKNSASYHSWSGLAFEVICLTHIQKIKRALGLSGVQAFIYSWNQKSSLGGAQIDLIIDRSDHCINLCEIKFYNDELILKEPDAITLLKKLMLFKEITKTKKTLFTTLISSYGAKLNRHLSQSVQSQVTLEALFD